MKAHPRPPKKIEITIPKALLIWACESEENKEELADMILEYVDYCYITNSKISFMDYFRSDDNES